MAQESAPVLNSFVDIEVTAEPLAVYQIVSDLPRSGEWSPECTGGSWLSGEPRTVGAVFRGENRRSADVVPWAPVVRGDWVTEAEVVTAEPGAEFGWAMRDSAGRPQDSVWSFRITPTENGGSRLAHHFRMGVPTEGIRKITAGMTPEQYQRFFIEWGDKVAGDMRKTLDRVKSVIEKTA
jgi:hypothetical protein